MHCHIFLDGSMIMTLDNNSGSEGKNSYRVPLTVRYDLIPPIFLKELSEVYEEGAQVYGEVKYIEQPLPFSSIYNHLMNHLQLYASGDRSEKHLAKIGWAVASMMVLENLATDGLLKSTNDLSGYGARVHEAIQKRMDAKNGS